MAEISYDELGLKVGLEIHQQLSTNKKLFCNCPPLEIDEYTSHFSRKLRASKSEMGEYDPAAIFESTKSKTIVYHLNSKSSCLVEQDEEPPHGLDSNAKNITLLISSALKSNIFSEIHIMRKIVIDGSNTTGFQRTMLISTGGYFEVNGQKIGVQAVSLEEDAAKLLKDADSIREYSLERLGIPLVEIALEPVAASPSEIRLIALTLGRILRSTKRVTRGIGSIRQDVNVSIKGGGAVVEIKGVQQLDQLEKVIEYEAERQHGLLMIKNKISELKTEKISKNDIFDVTEIFQNCKSKLLQKALSDGAVIKGIRVKNFSGVFSYEPYKGIRLGKELGQLVRFFGIGGIFHSDELPNYGIEISDTEKIKKKLSLHPNDGFILIAGNNPKLDFAIDSIINRIEDTKKGVPAETRGATNGGETLFLRPRAGASRMYPETDISPIPISNEEIEIAKCAIPKSWDESLAEIQKTYNLNRQLSEQIFDSDYFELFEKICNNKQMSPNFVASVLCSTITNLQRQGLDSSLLDSSQIIASFNLLADGKISKETIEIIFETIMSGKAKTSEEAIQKASLNMISDDELNQILDKIINENNKMISAQGKRSVSPLMGLAMKLVRGRVSGDKVNKLLQNKISEFLKNEI